MTTTIDHQHSHKPEIRDKLIIDLYRQLTKQHSILKDKEYWTIGGKCYEPNSEYDQIIKSGLVTPNQFHSVSIYKGDTEKNRQTHPQANFYHGGMKEALQHNDINPAIIHYDTQATIDTCEEWFELCIHDKRINNCLMIFNTILKSEWYGIDITLEEVVRRITRMNPYLTYIEFEYKGEKSSRMGGVCCFKTK